MSRRIPALVTTLLPAACGGGGSGGNAAAPPVPPVSGPAPAERLEPELQGLEPEVFFEQSYAAVIERTPEAIVWQALGEQFPLETTTLDDLSDGYRRGTRQYFADIQPLATPADAQNYDTRLQTEEALRAARLVMDTGSHHHGWSFAQAVQFNEDNVAATNGAVPLALLDEVVDRYIDAACATP